MKEEIINSGQPKEKVFTVPNLIHLPNDLHYKAPKENKIPVIGVCARFAPIKGVDIFIKALGELKKRGLQFKAHIAGDGKAKEEYLELIAQLDLKEEVVLLGWIDDRESFYKNIDIFCLPSREEAFGLVILESMVHSLPMVLSKLSGPLEIVGDSKSALLVPPEDSVKLADGLEQLMQNKQLAKELSWNAFQRVQHYSATRVAPLLQETLERIVTLYADFPRPIFA
jgi:glycosyltransferase involved in cell wall biosynthesis